MNTIGPWVEFWCLKKRFEALTLVMDAITTDQCLESGKVNDEWKTIHSRAGVSEINSLSEAIIYSNGSESLFILLITFLLLLASIYLETSALYELLSPSWNAKKYASVIDKMLITTTAVADVA